MGKYDALKEINMIRGDRARTGTYNVMYRRHVQVRACGLVTTNAGPEIFGSALMLANQLDLPAQAHSRA